MANAYEADPRWIVENRADGKNVNNWHWVQSDRLPWSKTVITELLTQTVLDTDEFTFKITSVPTVEGECNVNNRKGKTIFLYEINVKANWIAETKGDNKIKVQGEFSIPYISDENGEEKPKVTYSVTTKEDDDNKSFINKLSSSPRSQSIEFVQKKAIEFVQRLKKEFTLKPATNSPTTSSDTTTSTPPQPVTPTTTTTTSTPTSTTTTPKVVSKTKTLTIIEEFQASPLDSYDVFTNPAKIAAYTQDKVEFENKEGGKFSLYGGMIRGTNVQLVPGSKLVQKWRLNSWPQNVESEVTITFKVESKPATKIEIVQTGIPVDEFEKTEEGWRRNILERLKSVFGYSSRIY
ncbi:activator of Hsp90 ATPase family protein [Tieghemostelium lacteum]|uniref:Activator of Hsp90 ATPase family protein n=1 Tax=Tieghemostelium lacteum TaxID=361077 RepID=A0A151ZAZ1_TIELA|nr:activator of Hsp90 ATPase family protein [Tieghemostelium lacteum]|eukprot:KYQ91054.1 activator of Hsp90 ATPase family protein [Tieghemostelium lacteum]